MFTLWSYSSDKDVFRLDSQIFLEQDGSEKGNGTHLFLDKGSGKPSYSTILVSLQAGSNEALMICLQICL